MPIAPISISELNSRDQNAFVDAIGFVFEGSPWIAAQAWQNRPFRDVDQLHKQLVSVVNGAPEELRLALIRAHPDLVGRAALSGTLTAQSTQEQSAAGLTGLSAEDIAAFTRYNTAYHTRFGFPFVICARENKKESILAAFPERLLHTREQEMHTALAEIAKIARLRLLDIVLEG